MMQDRSDLFGQLLVDQRDRLVERHRQILRIRNRSAQCFFGLRLQQELRLFRLRLLGRADRLIQQTDFRGGGLRGCFFAFRGHLDYSLGLSAPSWLERVFNSASLCSTRSKIFSSSAERSTLVIKSRSWLRVSRSFLSAGTCSAIRPGSKSSIVRNFNSTGICESSPASVLSTLMLSSGAMRSMTSLKFSLSI